MPACTSTSQVSIILEPYQEIIEAKSFLQSCNPLQSLTSDARGWEDATMPLLPRTGDLRLLKSMM